MPVSSTRGTTPGRLAANGKGKESCVHSPALNNPHDRFACEALSRAKHLRH
jgi:hypothetical protein